jgi:hypothetical protein
MRESMLLQLNWDQRRVNERHVRRGAGANVRYAQLRTSDGPLSSAGYGRPHF